MRTADPLIVVVVLLLLATAPAAAESLLLTNVHVLAMDGAAPPSAEERARLVAILVQDGGIAAIGDPAPPEGCAVVDGAGGWVIPGLCDMHVHLRRTDERWLFLANGVTAVRNMSGQPWHLDQRARIAGGAIAGPRLLTAGPILNNFAMPGAVAVTTPAAAAAEVQAQIAAGYDFIKVYSWLTQEVYDQVLASAGTTAVAGHVPGLTRGWNDHQALAYVLDHGQRSVEHLHRYATTGGGDAGEIDQTLARGVWNCPTLTVMENNQDLAALQAAARAGSLPVLAYVPTATQERWLAATSNGLTLAPYQALTARLHQAGALLMAGTDTVIPYAVAGFALQRELQLLAGSGIPNYHVLRMATALAADFCGWTDAGRCLPGRRADLVLLDADPLEAIANTGRIRGVMAAGRWYLRPDLDLAVQNVAARRDAGRMVSIRVDQAPQVLPACAGQASVREPDGGCVFGGDAAAEMTITFVVTPGADG